MKLSVCRFVAPIVLGVVTAGVVAFDSSPAEPLAGRTESVSMVEISYFTFLVDLEIFYSSMSEFSEEDYCVFKAPAGGQFVASLDFILREEVIPDAAATDSTNLRVRIAEPGGRHTFISQDGSIWRGATSAGKLSKQGIGNLESLLYLGASFVGCGDYYQDKLLLIQKGRQ